MELGTMVGAVGNGTRYDGGSSWEWKVWQLTPY